MELKYKRKDKQVLKDRATEQSHLAWNLIPLHMTCPLKPKQRMWRKMNACEVNPAKVEKTGTHEYAIRLSRARAKLSLLRQIRIFKASKRQSLESSSTLALELCVGLPILFPLSFLGFICCHFSNTKTSCKIYIVFLL